MHTNNIHRTLQKKYQTLYRKVKRAIQNGRFYRYTKRKQRQLLKRLQRYHQKLLRTGRLALPIAGFIVGTTSLSQAQTFTLITDNANPFININPFGLKSVAEHSNPSFVDIDGDGDLDAFVGEGLGDFFYFENIDTSTDKSLPTFVGPSTNPFGLSNVGMYSSISFIDGDGDLDAFSGEDDGTINYFENKGTSTDNSSPTFTTPISNPFGLSNVGMYSKLSFVDIDGDFDAFVGEYDGTINYFENKDTSTNNSSPSFIAPISNPFGLSGISKLSAPNFADIDGDGDFDAFVGEYDGTINYFENKDTSTDKSSPTFVGPYTNSFGLVDIGYRSSPSFVDIDNDGDIDAFSGNENGKIFYFKNASTNSSIPAFVVPFIDVGYNSNPSFADIDNDGDLDAFIGDEYGNILFYKNLDTSTDKSTPVFTFSNANPFGLRAVDGFSSPSFADIDNDGDLDALIGDYNGNIIYFENTSTNSSIPAFTSPSTNPFGLSNVGFFSSPSFVDIDGDGDFDAFVGGDNGSITYFENQDSSPNKSMPAFISSSPFGLFAVPSYAAPTFVDIDSDGDFDAFVGDGNGNIFYSENTSKNKSMPAFANADSNDPFNLLSVNAYAVPTFVDIDNDGLFEAIIGRQDGKLDYYESDIIAKPFTLEPIEPIGSEFQVNETITSNQQSPSIAVDSDGDYVIAWVGSNQAGGDSDDVYAQRYGKDGTKLGNEFRVNETTINRQDRPSIGIDSDGNFIIAWQSSNQDGDGYGIYMQRYSKDGVPASMTDMLVNSFTTGNQRVPSIAVDSDGDFVVAWSGNGQAGDASGIYAQRFKKDGSKDGAEFLVNTTTTESQIVPSVSMDSNGDFVIAWQSGGYFSGYDIYAQRYKSDGTPDGNEFIVNESVTGNQRNPSVAMDDDGGFAIAWDSFGQDGDGAGIYAQRYDSTGNTVGGEFLVNCYTTSNQSFSSVAIDSDGDFVITWNSNGQDGSDYGIYAQRYDRNGNTVGEEFLVNTYTTNAQRLSSVGMDSDGDFVIAWQSSGQDGNGTGIYAQRYKGNKSTTICQTTLDLPNETITIDTKYQAEQTITSRQVLAAPDAIISYTAGTSITFKTGFHAQPGVNFTASIAPVNCGSSNLNEEVIESRAEEQAVTTASEELSIVLAPNPVSELLQLQLDSQMNGKAILQIIDLNGRIVQSKQLSLFEGQQTAQLDVSQLAAGTYFLRIQSPDGTVQQKFVKLPH